MADLPCSLEQGGKQKGAALPNNLYPHVETRGEYIGVVGLPHGIWKAVCEGAWLL